MRYLLPLLLLTACAHTSTGLAPDVQMPSLPAPLNEKAKPLPPLTDGSMGTLAVDSAEVSSKYNGVMSQVNTVIDAWECVRVSMNNKTDPKNCFK